MPGRALRREVSLRRVGIVRRRWNPRMPGRALRRRPQGPPSHHVSPPLLESPNARKGIKTSLGAMAPEVAAWSSWNPRMPGRALRLKVGDQRLHVVEVRWNPRMPGRALRLNEMTSGLIPLALALESPNARKGIKTQSFWDVQAAVIHVGWNPRMPGRALRPMSPLGLVDENTFGWNPRMPGRALRPRVFGKGSPAPSSVGIPECPEGH